MRFIEKCFKNFQKCLNVFKKVINEEGKGILKPEIMKYEKIDLNFKLFESLNLFIIGKNPDTILYLQGLVIIPPGNFTMIGLKLIFSFEIIRTLTRPLAFLRLEGKSIISLKQLHIIFIEVGFEVVQNISNYFAFINAENFETDTSVEIEDSFFD